MKTSVVDRFLRYVKIDTQSDYATVTFPSTAKQFDLANLLVNELIQLGLQDAEVDENGYVMATLLANTSAQVPVIGFIAHMDTSPDASGTGVNPQFLQATGEDLLLNPAGEIYLSPREFPELLKYTGQTLIATDGTTLLGADDKAGIAEIMAALEFLQGHPEIPRGTIKVGFTPDEEVGHGADRFDVTKFAADFAYTLDGGEIGELQYENFNAANAEVIIKGRSVHPGTAKNKMINASQLGIELCSMLPPDKRPELTEGYEGFIHLTHFHGDVEDARLRFILRDHDKVKFENLKETMRQAVAEVNARHGVDRLVLDMKDSYFNMKEKIEPVMHIIDLARQAMLDCGITPLVVPVRGGTDGSRLSFMGLPCPNLFTGGHNAHGRFEYIPVSGLEKAVEVIVRIAQLAVQGK